jgi:hypothetical protein
VKVIAAELFESVGHWWGVMGVASAKRGRASFFSVHWQNHETSMADEQQLQIIRQGVEVWNEWRLKNPELIPDLS